MNEEYTWNQPPRDIPVGTLVRFVPGRPRYPSELPRDPGPDNDGAKLIGQLAVTLTSGREDVHGWGGVFRLNTLRGDSFSHYGDFLEMVE